MRTKRTKQSRFIKKAKKEKMVLKIIYILIITIIFYNIIFLINTAITKKEYLEIFGISLFTMKTDSMKGDLNKNDFLLVRKSNGEDIEIGDIIAYQLGKNIKINKVTNIYFDNNSSRKCYVTKSNLNIHPDIEEIHDEKIIGKKILNIPILGLFLQIIQSRIISVIVSIILCVVFCFNRYTYKVKKERSKKKQFREK